MATMTALENTSGSYFGGLQNVASIDLNDVPPRDPAFAAIDKAAAAEMYAVLGADRQRSPAAADEADLDELLELAS